MLSQVTALQLPALQHLQAYRWETILSLVFLITAGLLVARWLLRVLRETPAGQPGGRALRRKAKRLARLGDAREAGRLFEILGDLDRAAEQYEKARAYSDAAGVQERAHRWALAAELYDKAGNPTRAAECLQRGGDSRQAAALFLKLGKETRAAEALEQGRRFGEAAALYERAGSIEKAAALHERAGDFAAAAEALERQLVARYGTGRRDQAAETLPLEAVPLVQKCAALHRLAQRPARAAAVFLQGGAVIEAAQCFLEAGEPRKALELYRAAGRFPEALDVCQLLGDEAAFHALQAEQFGRDGMTREAAEAWERAGDADRAAEAYREMGEWNRAGELLLRAEQHAAAAEMFDVAGEWARAGAAYSAARRSADAGRCYRQAGMVPEAAQAMAAGGDCYGAGVLLAEAAMAEEAIAILQRIPPESADYAPAGLVLGRLLLDRGLAQAARVRLQGIVGQPGVAGQTADLHYLLGRANEALDQGEEALEQYERVLAICVDHEDAGSRAAALRLRLAKRAVPADTTVVLAGRPGVPERYRVVRELGRGGMGIVYEVHHEVLRRRVALKVPAPAIQSSPRARERFLSEARIAAGLRHPNIVTVYDAGEANGGLYIAMAFIEGVNLEAHLANRGPMAPPELMPLVRQICAGLAHAHAHSIVHADVKPANMLLDAAGTVHLTDFGLARAWDTAEGSTLEARGTPSYIAPEQVRGDGLDPRTDIYSLGCTVYRMLAGSPPFAKGDVLYGHLHEAPPPLRALNPDIPEAMESAVLRCLAKPPADRFPSVAHVLNAFEDALSMAPTMPIEEAAAVPALAG